MITTHELARMLLARRNHTLHVEVLVDEDLDAPYYPRTTELRDVPGLSFSVPSDKLLRYDSDHDVLILLAGPIVAERMTDGQAE